MAQDFRNDLQSAVGTSPVNLIVAGDYDAVIGIRICNIVTSTVEVDVYITNSGNKYIAKGVVVCLLYTSPSPRDGLLSRMPSSA